MTDLTYIKFLYESFRNIFFGDSIPEASMIDFKLSYMKDCLGYSMHKDVVNQDNENYHEIAITSAYALKDSDIKSVLLHEMIHVWQYYCVSDKRYEKCSNFIAHDRVFKTKMACINAKLEEMCEDFRLSVTAEMKNYFIIDDNKDDDKNDI